MAFEIGDDSNISFKGNYNVPLNTLPLSSNQTLLFIQKIFYSAIKKSVVWSGSGGSGSIYTVPNDKVFILLSTMLHRKSIDYFGAAQNINIRVNAIEGNNTINLIAMYETIGTFGAGAQIIPFSNAINKDFPSPLIFNPGTTFEISIDVAAGGTSAAANILGFEIDKYEWDKYKTP